MDCCFWQPAQDKLLGTRNTTDSPHEVQLLLPLNGSGGVNGKLTMPLFLDRLCSVDYQDHDDRVALALIKSLQIRYQTNIICSLIRWEMAHFVLQISGANKKWQLL